MSDQSLHPGAAPTAAEFYDSPTVQFYGGEPLRHLGGKREYLAICGKSLFGERWQSELARELQVNARTVRRWISGDREISGPVIVAITLLIEKKRLELQALLRGKK